MRFRIQDVYYNTDPVFVTCLIVGVGEELDHEGEEVGGGARSQWRAEVPWQEGTDKVTDASAILE